MPRHTSVSNSLLSDPILNPGRNWSADYLIFVQTLTGNATINEKIDAMYAWLSDKRRFKSFKKSDLIDVLERPNAEAAVKSLAQKVGGTNFEKDARVCAALRSMIQEIAAHEITAQQSEIQAGQARVKNWRERYSVPESAENLVTALIS